VRFEKVLLAGCEGDNTIQRIQGFGFGIYSDMLNVTPLIRGEESA
jgi:hypothetical protein